MRVIYLTFGLLLFFMPTLLHADADSEFRAEILGENTGKAIAKDHGDYDPDKAAEACRESFYKTWEEHFKEKGFSTDEGVVNSYVKGCMNKYNKAFGK